MNLRKIILAGLCCCVLCGCVSQTELTSSTDNAAGETTAVTTTSTSQAKVEQTTTQSTTSSVKQTNKPTTQTTKKQTTQSITTTTAKQASYNDVYLFLLNTAKVGSYIEEFKANCNVIEEDKEANCKYFLEYFPEGGGLCLTSFSIIASCRTIECSVKIDSQANTKMTVLYTDKFQVGETLNESIYASAYTVKSQFVDGGTVTCDYVFTVPTTLKADKSEMGNKMSKKAALCLNSLKRWLSANTSYTLADLGYTSYV